MVEVGRDGVGGNKDEKDDKARDSSRSRRI